MHFRGFPIDPIDDIVPGFESEEKDPGTPLASVSSLEQVLSILRIEGQFADGHNEDSLLHHVTTPKVFM